jgi:ATPase subunit of ABC transporter with duplicated ATPase domains
MLRVRERQRHVGIGARTTGHQNFRRRRRRSCRGSRGHEPERKRSGLPVSRSPISYCLSVALLGENGVGKSTLLKRLLDPDVAKDGHVRFGPNAKLGYFAQENTLPDDSGTVIQIMSRYFPNDQVARSALGRYGLGKHDKHKYSQLSGGQKARIQLIILETLEPNVLMLDEPTDNLDLESILVIERVLLDLDDATQVAITHDREFTRIFDRWIVFDKDGLVGELLDRQRAVEIVSGRRFSLIDEPGVKLLTRY